MDDQDARLELWLIRHGATEWSASGRHTGRTDVPLSPAGEQAARALTARLAGVRFDLELSSPLQRARRTAELAGLHPGLEPLALEWDYGQAEGLTRGQMRDKIPGWSPWTHEMPGGESLAQLGERADRLLAKLRQGAAGLGGEHPRAVLVAHGHFLRVLSARWVQEEPALGQRLAMEPATVSVLGYDRETPVLLRWNS
jgi:broad specificity phosphatase PhoE